MAVITSFLFLILNSSSPAEVDYAGIFASEQDRWAGGASICLWREVRPTDHVIAHRTLPCGTKVLIRNLRTKLSTVAMVGDHGPYGACIDEGWQKGTACKHWVVKRKETDPGIWRGEFDITPSVAKAIGQVGIELVEVRIIPKAKFFAKTTRPSA